MFTSISPEDQLAFDYTMVGEPVWNRIEIAREVLPLGENCLLHAGPPFEEGEPLSKPILHSACVAVVYEGLTTDLDEAEGMILAGEINLMPAQDYCVVTPLASVVSPSMPLQAIYDAHRGTAKAYSPINGGNAPAARLGLKSMEVVEHLKWLNSEFAATLASGLAEGIDLIPIAHYGLQMGDDCHGRTLHSTQMLFEEINSRTQGSKISARCMEFFTNCPSLFLNLWMAATKCILMLGENVPRSSLVTTAGGNGNKVGIKISSDPKNWIATTAKAPEGPFDVNVPETRALGAIGDSALVDIYGLGAMAIQLNPLSSEKMSAYLPTDFHNLQKSLLIGDHIGFRGLGIRFGMTAQKILEANASPVIALGILDNEGILGRLGGGIYQMPMNLFKTAITNTGSH